MGCIYLFDSIQYITIDLHRAEGMNGRGSNDMVSEQDWMKYRPMWILILCLQNWLDSTASQVLSAWSLGALAVGNHQKPHKAWLFDFFHFTFSSASTNGIYGIIIW